MMTSSLAHAEEEVICDPENPSCVIPSQPSTSSSEFEQVEEICDPENPSCVSDEVPDSRSVLMAAPDEASLLARARQRASFKVDWGSSLALDTRWRGDTEDILEWGSGLDATFILEQSERSRIVMQAQLRHWMGTRKQAFVSDREDEDTRAAIDVRLGESYWLGRRGRATLRAGMLVTTWGSTALVKPSAVINPNDQRNFGMVGPSMSDGTLAHPAVELSWSKPGGVGVELLYVPFFVPDQSVLFGNDRALLQPNNPLAATFPVVPLLEQLVDPSAWEGAQTLATATSYPDEDLSTSSLGGRLTRTLWNTDLGLGYFWGWGRTPRVAIDEDVARLATILLSDEQFLQDLDFTRLVFANPEILMLSQAIGEKREAGEELFATEYQRRHTLVLDVARYLGPVGVRAEAALSPAQNFLTTQLGTVRRPSVFGAIGLSYERLLGDEGALALTAEGFLLKPFAHDSEVTQAFVPEEWRGDEETEIALIGSELYGVAAGGTLRLPEYKVDVTLGGVYNVSTRDVIGRASLRRGLSSTLGVTLGGALYEGPPLEERLTLGGLYDGNDQLWLGVDGVF